jgi:GTP-binding protein
MTTIKKAEFVKSSSELRQCPSGTLPEFAFIGRSNVGKSSLINMLTGNSRLAQTSMTPGKTILINHFLIDGKWYLVDLPGYGYARRGKEMQEKFQRMISNYILRRANLCNLFVLIDGNIPPQRIDLEFIQWLGENGIPFTIVFTKSDKSGKGRFLSSTSKFLDTLKETWEELPPHYTASSVKKQGREELLEHIGSMLAAYRQDDEDERGENTSGIQ